MFDLGTAVGYLMLDSSGFSKGMSSAKKDLDTFMDKTTSFKDKVGAAEGFMSKMGGTLTKNVTLPLVGAGTALVGFAANSEEAFSQFEAKVGDVTLSMDSYKKVMDDIYKNNYGESYDDIADAMGEVVNRLGEMSPEKLQETTESAFALRDVFGYDVSESLRTADTLMKNFGLTSEQAFDYIVKGNQEGLDYSGEFLDAINEYSVQFQKLGFDANDMFNILKEGAESGAWNLDKIGDAIKEFSIRAIDGSDTTVAGFEKLGLSADDMAAKFAAGGDTAKQAFSEVISKLAEMEDPLEQNTIGVNLFGTMWEDLGPEVVTQLNDITNKSIEMQGSMDKLKEVKYDNLSSALAGLGRSFQVAGAELGQTLIPKVESLIGFVDGAADAIQNMSPGMQEAIVNFGLVAAAIGPVALVISKVIALLPVLQGLLAALTGPIGIVVAAVAALALAWATDFGGIRDATTEFFESIKEIISTAMSFIKEAWESDLMGIRTIAETVWENIEIVFSTAFDILKSIFDIFASVFKGDWEGVWEGVKDIFSTVWDAIKALLDNFLEIILTVIVNIGLKLWDAAKTAFGYIKDGFSEIWDSIVEWFQGAIEDPVGTIKDIGSDMFEAGKEIFTMLWDGIKSIWTDIKGWVDEKVDWLIDKVKFWEKESEKIEDDGERSSGGRSGVASGKRSVDGSYASGLDYVPRDMVVQVHEGEMISTAGQTRELINAFKTLAIGAGSGDLHVTVPVNGAELARATLKDFRRVSEANPEVG